MNIDQILRKATAHIGREYFELPVAGQENPIYRERVYCYELYHQLRLGWPKGTPYSLSGEVDKSGHPLIRNNGLDHAKPDFLVHVPGDMDQNLLVVEVKPVNAKADDIKTDLKKLTAFCCHANYTRAIYLIYGHDDGASQSAINKLREIARSFAERDRREKIDLDAISLWHHDAPESPANPVPWQT